MNSTARALFATALLATLGISPHAQATFSTPRQTLTPSERAPYLAAMRKAWVEVDGLSDAKPVAACFIDHVTTTTPLTLVPTRNAAEVVLRFFSMSDLERRGETAPKGDVTLSVLLQNDEMVWQGNLAADSLRVLMHQPRPSAGQDRACQDADTLAGELRDAMRKARADKQ